MRQRIAALAQAILAKSGYSLQELHTFGPRNIPSDMEDEVSRIIGLVRPFTMTSPERIYALVKAVEYLCRNNVAGDCVECGVWRGGSSMALAQRLYELDDTNRRLWLYDTFAGMPRPTEVDVSRGGLRASVKFARLCGGGEYADWCRSDLAEVKANMARTPYPRERIRYVQGKVEETIPDHAPEQIALLRLDTDWYSSTRHELEHLYPRVVRGGVVIIDDYGHWAGCKKAVDEYLSSLRQMPLLCRIDHSGRVAIKP